jgi:hypothetical protein
MCAHGCGGYCAITGAAHGFSGLPFTALLISILLTLAYVSTLYLMPALYPILENRLPGIGRTVTLPWAKILGTFAAAMFALGIAKTVLTVGPEEKPNCLSHRQILGISPEVDSVLWDVLAPLLATALLMAPLFTANILVAMVSEASMLKTGSSQPDHWKLLLGRVLVRKAKEHGNSLFLGDHTIYQGLLFVQRIVYHIILIHIGTFM